ncbi:polyprenyl synthetase family protein [Bacillus cereus]|uniref:polyprenyl synthetase family protein n=1 Tax=Bacillus cereus TaxID=1396 RepID=UPI002B24B79A|nr:polyprenyl synthetase family protein [Bacillus cereus]MEB2588753.1 polyprenyl synthetase family protein [Bacillus cereus]MEB2615391.1 polyprenyl synthetase family protein [Bacillus cereus]
MRTYDVKNSMFSLLDFYIENLEIREEIYKFIESKEEHGFYFSRLTILHFEMFNGSSNEIIKAASAVEYLNLALDIIDDIQDEDNAGNVWGSINKATLLNYAILLIFISQKILIDIELMKKDAILRYFNELTITAIQGQHLDLNMVCTNEEQYLEIIKKKSGALTSLAVVIGVLIAQDNYALESIIEYATYIGISGQLLNDASDVIRLDDKSDVRNKKLTFPVLYLLNHPSQNLTIVKSYYNDEIGFGELIENRELIIKEILNSKAIEYTLIYKEIFVQKALEIVKGIAFSNQKKKYEFIDFLLGGGK